MIRVGTRKGYKKMKIMAMADIHIGKKRFRKTDENDENYVENFIEKYFEECLKIVVKEKPDMFVVCGDVFHKANPSVKSISSAKRLFQILENGEIETYILGGNHDSNKYNFIHGTHPFEFFPSDWHYVHPIWQKEQVLKVDETQFYFSPWCVEAFEEAERQRPFLASTSVGKVIFGHGILSEWGFSDPDVLNYDNINALNLICLGHYHHGSISTAMNGKTVCIVPGDLFDCDDSGIIQFNINTETGEVGDIQKINGPNRVRYTSFQTDNKEELNNFLRETISTCNENLICNIIYHGMWDDIDREAYNELLGKIIHLSLEIEKTKERISSIKKVENFWPWVEEFYPKYNDKFKAYLNKRKGGEAG